MFHDYDQEALDDLLYQHYLETRVSNPSKTVKEIDALVENMKKREEELAERNRETLKALKGYPFKH